MLKPKSLFALILIPTEKIIDSKNVDEALKENKTVEHVIVVNRINNDTNDANFYANDTNIRIKYIKWNDLVAKQSSVCLTEMMESSDPAFYPLHVRYNWKAKGNYSRTWWLYGRDLCNFKICF